MKVAYLSGTVAALGLLAGCSGDDRNHAGGAGPDGGRPPAETPAVPPPTGLWVRSIESVGDEGIAAVVARADASFVVLGHYEGPGTFNVGRPDESVLAEPDGATETMLAHYDPDGSLRSVRPDPLGTGAGSVHMAADGSVYVTGSGAFAAGSVVVPHEADVYVARYDADMTPLWAHGASGEAGEGAVTAVAAWRDGGVVIGGPYQGTITFGVGEPNETRLASSSEEMFLARYDADGRLRWAKRAVATPYLPELRLAAAADGAIALYGTLENDTTFSPGLPDETRLDGGNVGFLVMLDDAGTVQWARALNQTEGTNRIERVAAFPDGSVVAVGSFTRILSLGAGEPERTTLAAVGSEFPGRTQFPDFFAARFDRSGELVWARREGGEVWDAAGHAEALEDGATLVAGSYTNEVTFGDGEPAATTLSTPTNEMTAFVAIIDADGSLRWARQGVSGQVAHLEDGSVAIAGTFMGTVTLFPGEVGETTLASAGGWDAYIVRLGWEAGTP